VTDGDCGAIPAVVDPVGVEILGHLGDGAAAKGSLHAADALVGEVDADGSAPVVRALAKFVE
jgi:hypothetical protein